jgi:hypothetical protein
MHIKDAIFDVLTGSPILKGTFKVISNPDGIIPTISVHNYILFELGTYILENGLRITAINHFSPNLGSAYNVESLNIALIIHDFGSDQIKYLQDFDQSGKFLKICKTEIASIQWREAESIWSSTVEFTSMECSAPYTAEGMQLTLIVHNESMCSVQIETTLTWETLVLLGISAPAWKFGPEITQAQMQDLERKRSEWNPADLLMSSGLTWPMIEGNLSLEPLSGGRIDEGLSDLKWLNLIDDQNEFRITEARRPFLQNNGFVHTMASNFWFSTKLLNKEKIGRNVFSKGRYSISAVGDDLGRLTFDTGQGMEFSDPLGRITQQISEIKISVDEKAGGLLINLEGALAYFDPQTAERHQKERGNTPHAYATFSLKAILPWSLLFVRQYLCSRKGARFGVAPEQTD